jgi:hypothetical protein
MILKLRRKKLMKLTRIISILALLSLVAVPALGEMTDYQKGIAEGLEVGFFMNEKYEQATQGINVTGYNAEVQRYNAWIVSIFGSDTRFLMTPMAMGASSKPVMVVDSTNATAGVVHQIDGDSKAKGPGYTTNDMNLLPESALNTRNIWEKGGEFLGGI